MIWSISFSNLQAQATPSFDFETCINGVGGNANPTFVCTPPTTSPFPASFTGTPYSFPALLFFQGTGASISPTSAGTVVSFSAPQSGSFGSSPTVCINWNEPGFHDVTVFYGRGEITQSRTRTVYVSRTGVNYAAHTLTGVSNCSAPNSAFTVNRSSHPSGGPVKAYCIEVNALNGAGIPIFPAVFSTGWQDENLTSKTFTSANTGGALNFTAGTNFVVTVQTQSACGDHSAMSSVITGAALGTTTVDFSVNGETSEPVHLFSCHNSDMIIRDNTTSTGCSPGFLTATFTMEKGAGCGASVAGTAQTVTVPYANSYNLRSLFPVYTAQPGLYRVSYRVFAQGTGTTFGPKTRCVLVNDLNASNAEFLLKAPNNGNPLPRNPSDPSSPNTQLGQFSCGLYLANPPSFVGSLDYYRVEIWKIGVQGNTTIHNSGNIPINTSNPFPLGYDFNPPTSAHFFNLTPQQIQDNRYKVRFTVHNQCGEAFQESFFRIKPGCITCLISNGGDGTVIETEEYETGDRAKALEVAESVDVSILPNPFEAAFELSVLSSTLQKAGLFEVFDANGRKMHHQKLQVEGERFESKSIIDAIVWPPGLYAWRLMVGQEVRTGRIVRQ